MKLFQGKSRSASTAPMAATPSAGVARRNIVVGAGAAGAAAIAAHSLQRGVGMAPAVPVVATVVPGAGDGYQVTAHVLRYYETAKI